jgi:hypothetical protein
MIPTFSFEGSRVCAATERCPEHVRQQSLLIRHITCLHIAVPVSNIPSVVRDVIEYERVGVTRTAAGRGRLCSGELRPVAPEVS